MSARTKSRKRALDLLYGADLKSLSIRKALESEVARAESDRPRLGSWQYARQIVEGIADHLPLIDELIETHAQGWTIERMPIIDRAILRIGIWELRFNSEIPPAVAISEAVTAARTYSTEDSAGFVNGLLGRIAQLPEASPL